MTEKRLYDVIDEEEPRGQSVTYEGIPCTARTCVTRLNRLTEENEELKSILYDIVSKLEMKISPNKDTIYAVTIVVNGKIYQRIIQCLK